MTAQAHRLSKDTESYHKISLTIDLSKLHMFLQTNVFALQSKQRQFSESSAQGLSGPKPKKKSAFTNKGLNFSFKQLHCAWTEKVRSNRSTRATGPVLTSDKEENHVVLPTTLNFVVRRGKLRSYTLKKTPRYSESLRLGAIRNVLEHVLPIWRGSLHSFKTCEQNKF